MSFTRKQAIILPQLKLQDDVPIFVQFESAIYLGKEIKDAKGETSQADIANVVNLETGELCQIVVGTILKETLTETFKDDSYVGKKFEITRHKAKDGKRYKTYALYELE